MAILDNARPLQIAYAPRAYCNIVYCVQLVKLRFRVPLRSSSLVSKLYPCYIGRDMLSESRSRRLNNSEEIEANNNYIIHRYISIFYDEHTAFNIS